MENKIVLVIGAGFSYPAKLPIQDLLIDKLLPNKINTSFLKSNFNADENSLFLIAYIYVVIFLLKVFYDAEGDIDIIEKEFRDIKQLYYQRKESVYRNSDELYRDLLPIKIKLSLLLEINIMKYSKISFEDIFTILDKAINDKTKINSYHYTKLVIIKNSLLFLFIYYFNLELREFKEYYEKYENIINFIKKNKNNISIITTNWDNLIEKYFIEDKIEYDYNFNNSYTNILNKIKNIQNKIPIIKIHGSIDWFTCISCNNMTTVDYSRENNFIFRNDFNIVCQTCNDKNKINEILLLPEIITPTMIKSLNSQLFINLWKAAFDYLKKADEIIFIGYSFPTADFELRYLLKKSINNNAKISVILSENDDPKKYDNKNIIKTLPEYRYKSLFI